MIGKLIPFGYAAPGAEQRLGELMTDPKAILVDIRWSPYSRFPQWRKDVLMRQFGDYRLDGGRYRHMSALGNMNHAIGGQVRLANPAHGVDVLKQLLEEGHTVILMCACRYAITCHRSVVAKLVQEQLPDIIIEEETV